MEESDQISELPDNILQRILSLLPIKDKIRTSVLSKRWLHLWPSNPMLNFGHCIIDLFNDDDVAAAALDRCLHSSTANLQIMHLRLNIDYLDGSHVTRLDRWIHRADERFLSVLELHFSDFYDRFDEELPISLFSCRWLSELLLSGCVFRRPSSVPLNFCSKLRSLKLQHVRITNEILASVLQACTFLESLILSCPYGLTQLEISNQNLQLKWLVVNDLVSSCRVVIADAPNLQFILYSGNLLNLSFMKKLQAWSRPFSFRAATHRFLLIQIVGSTF